MNCFGASSDGGYHGVARREVAEERDDVGVARARGGAKRGGLRERVRLSRGASLGTSIQKDSGFTVTKVQIDESGVNRAVDAVVRGIHPPADGALHERHHVLR